APGTAAGLAAAGGATEAVLRAVQPGHRHHASLASRVPHLGRVGAGRHVAGARDHDDVVDRRVREGVGQCVATRAAAERDVDDLGAVVDRPAQPGRDDRGIVVLVLPIQNAYREDLRLGGDAGHPAAVVVAAGDQPGAGGTVADEVLPAVGGVVDEVGPRQHLADQVVVGRVHA